MSSCFNEAGEALSDEGWSHLRPEWQEEARHEKNQGKKVPSRGSN